MFSSKPSILRVFDDATLALILAQPYGPHPYPPPQPPAHTGAGGGGPPLKNKHYKSNYKIIT